MPSKEAVQAVPAARYGRVLLKLSGEALMGEVAYGIDPQAVARIAHDVRAVHDKGVEVCLVVGGGNIFRGLAGVAAGIDRATADGMGMLATIINALALQSTLEGLGLTTRVVSAIPMQTICEPYIRRRAVRHMEKGRVVICAAGTGNPYFTTDTAAALRAAELGCQGLFKGTQVDGVYSSDPKSDRAAVRFDRISYSRVLAEDLKVMDATAISLARDNGIPVIVFSIHSPGAFAEVVCGQGRFTMVSEEE
ncbi:MAG TPA: UMP kinase [Alphaproteobacteria bacterium]